MCNETNTYLEVYRSLTEEQACERTFVDAHPAALCFTTDTNRIVFGGKAFFANRSVYYCEIDDLAEHCSLKTVKRNCGTYRVIDHDNNFSASLIQYLVSHGRKVVQIYVHYQEGGAVCEVRTCSVNEDNVCGVFGPWQLVNRTIEGLAIDSHLDETSANAVQNAAVTKEIRGFEERVEEELGNAAAEMAGALHQVDKKIKDAGEAIDKANASGEQAMASAKYALEKAGEAAMAAHDADEASKSATAASKSAMSARDLALSAYSNALEAGRAAFDTANSAKAAEAKREDAEAVRISAEKRREENEEYRYNGFSRIQSGFAQITDTFNEALMATGQAVDKAETAADAATQAAESANVAVEEVKKILAEGGKVELRPVASLPLLSDAERGVIYLLPVADIDDEGNLFDEFIVVNGKWERFGTGHIDMTGYATKGMLDQELANKQDKLTTYHETPFGAKMSSTDNQMSVSLGSGVISLTNSAGDNEHKLEIDKTGVYIDDTDINNFIHSIFGESVEDPNTGEPTFAIVGASGGDRKSVIVPVARKLTDESGTSYQHGVMSSTTLKMLYDSAAEVTALDHKVGEFEEDFAKYENRPNIELTPIVSGKYINSEGKYVDAAGWAVAEIGSIEKGLRYKLFMKDSSEMVFGAALFVSRVRTFDDKGEAIRTTLTPIFSARDTNIPTHGKVVLKAWDDYADVLVCYKPALTDKIEVVCYGGDKSDATQMKNLKDDIDRKATKAGRYLDLTSGMTLAFEPTKDGDTTAYDERLTAGRNVNFAPELTERVPDEESKSYSLTFDGMRGEAIGVNQMVNTSLITTHTERGLTLTKQDSGMIKVTGSNISEWVTFILPTPTNLTIVKDHKYLMFYPNKGNSWFVIGYQIVMDRYAGIFTATMNQSVTAIQIQYKYPIGTVQEYEGYMGILDLTTLFPLDQSFVTSLVANDARKVLHRLSFFSYEQNMETLEITENVDDTLALGAEIIAKMGYQEPRLTFGSHGRIHLIDGKDGKTIKGTIDMRAAKRAVWSQVLEQLAAQGVDTSLPFMQEPFETSINDQVGIKWDGKGVEVNCWVYRLKDLNFRQYAERLYVAMLEPAKKFSPSVAPNFVTLKYKTDSGEDWIKKGNIIYGYDSGDFNIVVHDVDAANLSEFKASLTDEDFLVYQLATPIRVDFEDMALNLGFSDVQSDDFFALDDMDGNRMSSIDVQYETRDGVQYKKVRISPNAQWVEEHHQLPVDMLTSILGYGFTANYATMLQMYKDIQQLKNR